MCIKILKIGKQEVGIWRIQKRFPRYGVPIWSLWPNIRSLPSIVDEKNATKNILDGRRTDGQTDRGKTVYPPPPSGSGSIIKVDLWLYYVAFFPNESVRKDIDVIEYERLSNITLEHALFVKVVEEINLLYPRSLKGEGGILFYVRPSSVQDIFRRIFLSNCWWQKSDIWSQVSYRYTILWEAFLNPSDSYFLFADFVDFYTHWTYMLIFRHIFLSNY